MCCLWVQERAVPAERVAATASGWSAQFGAQRVVRVRRRSAVHADHSSAADGAPLRPLTFDLRSRPRGLDSPNGVHPLQQS